MSPVTEQMNGSMFSGDRASFQEVAQLREAIVALADEVLMLRAQLAPEETSSELLLALRRDESGAITRARLALAPGEDINQFAERLRRQGSATGPGGPPVDANAALRDARAQAYKRRWPGGTNDPDAQPKGWRRRGQR